MEIVRELCSFEGRLAGTDAERRARLTTRERLLRTANQIRDLPLRIRNACALLGTLFAPVLCCLVRARGNCRPLLLGNQCSIGDQRLDASVGLIGR